MEPQYEKARSQSLRRALCETLRSELSSLLDSRQRLFIGVMRARLGGLGSLAVFHAALIAQCTPFGGFLLVLGVRLMFVQLFLDLACRFFDVSFDAHFSLLITNRICAIQLISLKPFCS